MKKFAIITNIRDDADFGLVFPECRGKDPPKQKIWSTFFVNGDTTGDIIVLPLTGAMMMSDPKQAARRVFEAVLFAQEHGAELVGLTSLTSSVTMRGEWLIDQKGITAALTHGDTYAAALTLEGIQLVARKINRDLKTMRVAVLGPYGLIGRPVSIKLVTMCESLVLVGPNPNKLDRLVRALPTGRAKVTTSTETNAIADADIVITATSNPNALITPQLFQNDNKPHIVYEVSVPPNLPLDVYMQIRKAFPHVLKIDGAMASIPNIEVGVNITGVKPGTTFACWAETIMQALQDDHTDHVGEIDPEYINITLLWGRQYGFLHAPFCSFGVPISDEEFHNLKG